MDWGSFDILQRQIDQGLVVQRSSTSACHAEDRGFKSHQARFIRRSEAKLERPESNNCFRDFLLENKMDKAGKPAKV